MPNQNSSASPRSSDWPWILRLFEKILLGFVLTLFVFSQQDSTALSAGCFAVLVVVALMPWQLAPLIDDAQEKRKAVLCGEKMAFGSLVFLMAAGFRYGGFLIWNSAEVEVSTPLLGILKTAGGFLILVAGCLYVTSYLFASEGFLEFFHLLRNHTSKPDVNRDNSD